MYSLIKDGQMIDNISPLLSMIILDEVEISIKSLKYIFYV